MAHIAENLQGKCFAERYKTDEWWVAARRCTLPQTVESRKSFLRHRENPSGRSSARPSARLQFLTHMYGPYCPTISTSLSQLPPPQEKKSARYIDNLQVFQSKISQIVN